MKYEARTVSVMIAPEGGTLFEEAATSVTLDDEGGGEFVVLTQETGKVAISPEDWPLIRKAIDAMIATCRE